MEQWNGAMEQWSNGAMEQWMETGLIEDGSSMDQVETGLIKDGSSIDLRGNMCVSDIPAPQLVYCHPAWRSAVQIDSNFFLLKPRFLKMKNNKVDAQGAGRAAALTCDALAVRLR